VKPADHVRTPRAPTYPAARLGRSRFLRHYLEMVAAMLVGMVALGAALRGVLALAGLPYPTRYPELTALEMALTMSAGMGDGGPELWREPIGGGAGRPVGGAYAPATGVPGGRQATPTPGIVDGARGRVRVDHRLRVLDVIAPAAVLSAVALLVLVWGAADGRLRRPDPFRVQALGMLGFGALALVGLAVDPDPGRYLEAAGWFGDGIWDFVHLKLDKVVARSYALWCGILDIGIAAELVFKL
jgi:hypothetical protein